MKLGQGGDGAYSDIPACPIDGHSVRDGDSVPCTEEQFVYVLISAADTEIKDELSKALLKVPRESGSLATSFVRVYDTPCIGYIYRCDDPHSQEQFCRAIRLTLRD